MPLNPFKQGVGYTEQKVKAFKSAITINETGVDELTPAELEQIAKNDGKAGLSEQDFTAAGVQPGIAMDLVKMATVGDPTAFQTVGISFQRPAGNYTFIPPALQGNVLNPLRETIVARGKTMPVTDAAGKPVIDPATKVPKTQSILTVPDFDKSTFHNLRPRLGSRSKSGKALGRCVLGRDGEEQQRRSGDGARFQATEEVMKGALRLCRG